MEYLSDIELYISSHFSEEDKTFDLVDEEYHHAVKVMRNSEGQKIFATDGSGKIFEGIIKGIQKDILKASIINVHSFKNILENFAFCIPNLKNPERLKFALEKLVELGFTNLLIFTSERTISKNINLKRLEKVALSAMKQSLHSYFPKVNIVHDLKEIKNYGYKIVLLDQSSKQLLSKENFDNSNKYLFVFGPEGSFSERELAIIDPDSILNLGAYRLRSETAIIKCASIISEKENA